ncbi:MAG: polysaccharide biosynthesis C-terminal domain-containing protein [Candidatus Stygibacter australis]|nr:polysaccharide biosynthesis C-terminal domain-containing protein [Candidatus Stygibacter australis]MDP8321133.1 polysaccharide biosynthesis C-terminal domain-containing protein [Candidatus Stygibacter australis]
MIKKIRSSIKQSFYYGIGNVAVKFVGLILLPIYSRKFAIETYGLLALFEVFAEIVIAFSSLGIMGGFNRWYWDQDCQSKQKSLFFTTLLFSISSTSIFLLVSSWIICHYSMPIFSVEIGTGLMLIYLINIFFRVIVNRFLQLLQIRQLVKKQTKYVLLNMGVVLISTLFFILVLNMNLEGIFLGQICGNLIVIILILPTILSEMEFKIEWKLLKKIIVYSYPLAISGVMSIVMTLSDRFILKHFFTLGTVGQYSLAYKISSMVKLFVVRSFLKSYSSKYYLEINDEMHNKFFYKSVTYFTFISIYSTLVLCVLSGLLIKVLLNNENYIDSLIIVPYLLIGIVLEGIRAMLTMPLMKLNKTKIISLVSIGSGLLNVILNFLLIPFMGSIGAALTTAISKAVAVTIFLIYNRKYGYRDYEVVKYLKAIFVGAGLIYIWIIIPELCIFLRIVIDLIILILYPVILNFIGFFEKSEIKMIKQSYVKWSKLSNIVAHFKGK